MKTLHTSTRGDVAAKFEVRYGRPPTFVARAPGRIEFIGNHTDYNGGLVLGAAITQQVEIAVAEREDTAWNFAAEGTAASLQIKAGTPVRQAGAAEWTNYPLGVLHAIEEAGYRIPQGFDLLVTADLPAGAGLSSSAALELASALVFLALTSQVMMRTRLVELARRAENHFVGVPCGILDQGVSAFGKRGHLVLIDCAGPRFDLVRLPDSACFWLFNTHNKHALVDGLYAERHRECLEAARLLGVDTLHSAGSAQLRAAQLPPVLERRARHVIEEIARVRDTIAALQESDLDRVGELLTASHRSSQHLFENSTPELDCLVDTLVTQPGVYGARLTGGGFGGAVMALTSPDFGAPQVEATARTYHQRFGVRPGFFETRTGDGAALLT